jgi:tetratricopeptide (TPR) repeat protein
VKFKRWQPIIIVVLLANFLYTGCGYQKERRMVQRSKKVLAQERKSVDELVHIRGELRRVIELKLQSVKLLEDVNRLLGEKYMELGSYNLAEEVLLEAEFLMPHNAFIKKDLGQCYYFLGLSALDKNDQLKFFSKSRAYYTKALEIDPELIEARYGLGLLLFFGYNDAFAAIDEMKEILESDPENVDAHFALGRFYYEIGELGKALGEYIELTRLLPGGADRRKKAEENIIKINREMGMKD